MILAAQRHVVGYDVEHLAEVRLAERLTEALVRGRASQLVVDALMVDDIVAVHAAGRRLQIR